MRPSQRARKLKLGSTTDLICSETRSVPPVQIVWACLALAVATAALLDFIFFTGIFGSDDGTYLTLAGDMLRGHQAGGNARPSRLGVIAVAAAALCIARGEAQTASLLFAAFHLGLVLIVYELGARLHGWQAGLTAAVLTAFCPILVVYSGCVLPDTPAALFLAMSFTVTLARGRTARSGLPSSRSWFAAGVLLGVAYLMKEVSAVFAPVIAIMALWPADGAGTRQRLSRFGAAAGGFAVVVAAHLIVAHALYGSLSVLVKRMDFDPSALDYPILTPWGRGLDALARLDAQLGIFGPVLLGGVALYPFVRGRSWALWAAGIWLVAYSIWGSISPRVYVPAPLQARYFTVALPFAIVCLAAVLASGAGRLLRSVARWQFADRAVKAALCLAALIFFTGSVLVVSRLAGSIYYAPEANGVSQALDFALLNDNRGIVLSPMLSGRFGPLFFGGKHPDIRLLDQAGGLPRGEVALLLSPPGFLYVCAAEEQVRRTSGQDPSTPRPGKMSIGDTTNLAWLVEQALRGEAGALRVRRIATFYPYQDRLEAMLRWRNWHPGWVRSYDVKRAVYIYEVQSAEH